MATWITEKTIRVAEYFHVVYEKRELHLWPDGSTTFEGTPEFQAAKAMFGKPKKSRQSDKRVIKWCKTNGYETLEENEWLGKYIPIVRVIGNEYEVEGKLHISGLVRNAKDAQRMYNYWTSQEAEMLALAPKAPFVGYAGQFEGFETQWRTANTSNHPYLEVNADVTDGQGNVLPLPQRSLPPMAQTALIQAKMGAADDIKSTVGQYDSSIGATSNERSGKAIIAREKQADTGSYHYVDNLGRAVRYVTRQLVDLIPKIYDTARVLRIIGEDGETQMIETDPEVQGPVQEIKNETGVAVRKIYNLGCGKFDVMVITGPNYMTKRQEALEGMAQILQGNKELWAVAGDLFVKSMDWPGAQELAKRLKKMVDPKILEEGDDSPALASAKQQIEVMGQEMDRLHQMLESVKDSFEARDIAVKEFKADIDAFKAQTERAAAFEEKMTADQIQEVVLGTISSMISSGDLVASSPSAQMPDGEELPEFPFPPAEPAAPTGAEQ
jgi:hypothetical protein